MGLGLIAADINGVMWPASLSVIWFGVLVLSIDVGVQFSAHTTHLELRRYFFSASYYMRPL